MIGCGSELRQFSFPLTIFKYLLRLFGFGDCSSSGLLFVKLAFSINSGLGNGLAFCDLGSLNTSCSLRNSCCLVGDSVVQDSSEVMVVSSRFDLVGWS